MQIDSWYSRPYGQTGSQLGIDVFIIKGTDFIDDQCKKFTESCRALDTVREDGDVKDSVPVLSLPPTSCVPLSSSAEHLRRIFRPAPHAIPL